MAVSSTQQTANLVIDKETDARFWAQTGYKPGIKLDMSIPTDRTQGLVWNAIHAQVVAEDQAGKLRLTYNHPTVQQGIANAKAADAVTAANLELAKHAGDPTTRDARIRAAADAQARGQANANAVQQAQQHEVAPGDVATKAAQDAAANPPPSDAGADHHLAHHQAKRTPGAIADGRGTVGPPIEGHPVDELAIARTEGPRAAAEMPGDLIGYQRAAHGGSAVIPMTTKDQLVRWYNGRIADPDAHGLYIAAYDKHDSAWPGPIADGLGGEAAVLVTAHPPDAIPVVDPSAAPATPLGPAPVVAPPPLPELAVPVPPLVKATPIGKWLGIGAAIVAAGAAAYFLMRKHDASASASRTFRFRAGRVHEALASHPPGLFGASGRGNWG